MCQMGQGLPPVRSINSRMTLPSAKGSRRVMDSNEDQLVIRNYDATWPIRFSELANRVKAHLGALVTEVEHVGSTAVPGLIAKPIIDMDVVLASPSYLPEVIRRLGTLGYAHEGELGIVGREAFRWPSGEPRHHLYVLCPAASELRRHLAFRDALRADRTIRDAYSELKKRLALRYSHDRKAYTEAKSAFIKSITEAE
jgi:GrpB-like predicted nucleotidyltransferase (UPF0157 family)